MENEKAAIKRSLAQEARFRDEKQQIVESLGGSPAELLTPSSDSRLQRKLANNSKRGSSSLLAQDSAPSFQESPIPAPTPEQASSVADFVTFVVNDDHPVPLDHNNEREQYGDEEQTRKCNKKVYLNITGAFLALTLGSLIGVLVALLSRTSPHSSTGDDDNQCKLDLAALVQCANGILAVPVCAKATFEELANTYVLGEDVCDAAHKGLVSTAVSETNYGDDLKDPLMFFAMSTLFFALGGEKWRLKTGWLEGVSPCSSSWYGVHCSPSGSVKLQLDNNRLQGTIPREIGLLSNLETISVSNNDVAGSFPSEIGMLPRLKNLSAQLTEIGFSLPSEIGNLNELVELVLEHSPLTGTIPTEIGSLSKLETLRFHSNSFSGTVPTELENLVNLHTFKFQTQKISGSLPSNMFARLSNLQVLEISLPGTDQPFPLDEISIATNLKELGIVDTYLSGGLSALTSLSHLSKLHLTTATQLRSTIVTEIGLLSDLASLAIRYSDLEGNLPSELGLLTKLTYLDFGDSNSITGTLPSELGNLTNLETFDLSITRLTGTIPSELCALIVPYGDTYFKYNTCRQFTASECIIDTCS